MSVNEDKAENASNSPPPSINDPSESARKSVSDSESLQASSTSEVKQKSTDKVDVLLKPAGDAPIMKKKKWTVDRSKKICWISDFIRKYIKCGPSESLFLYVNQSFAPSPDTDMGSIFDCFGSDGKLVLHYCRTQAWG